MRALLPPPLYFYVEAWRAASLQGIFSFFAIDSSLTFGMTDGVRNDRWSPERQGHVPKGSVCRFVLASVENMRIVISQALGNDAKVHCGHFQVLGNDAKARCGHFQAFGNNAKAHCGHFQAFGNNAKAHCGHFQAFGNNAEACCGHFQALDRSANAH